MKCCELTPGHLRVPVSIYRKVRNPDGVGGSVDGYELVAQIRTKWKHASMGERLQAMAVQAHVMHKVWMRYNGAITPAMVMVDPDGTAYDIRGVVDIEKRRRWMELHVEEGVLEDIEFITAQTALVDSQGVALVDGAGNLLTEAA